MRNNWRLSILDWLKANKIKVIGFLAVITTTLVLVLMQYGVIMFKADDLKQAVLNFKATEQMNGILLGVTFMNLLLKFMIGVIAIYSVFLAVHFIQYDLKNKLKERGL